MSSLIESVESCIRERLSILEVRGVEVRTTPEVEAEHGKQFDKPRVTVTYVNSAYSDTVSTGEVVQDRTMNFIIRAEGRKLRNDNGVYALLQAIEALLIGWKPAGYQRIRFKDDRFESKMEGTWAYTAMVYTSKRVQQYDEAKVEALLQNVTFEEPQLLS